jgi:hypothetical protein
MALHPEKNRRRVFEGRGECGHLKSLPPEQFNGSYVFKVVVVVGMVCVASVVTREGNIK